MSKIEHSVLRGMTRFDIKRKLGAGGMGVVYEAFDKEKDSLVALKTLKHLSPQGLLLFKNEFRALTNLHHPNLIQLYELFAEEEFWFFSMELLSGQELLPFLLAPQPLATAETLAAQPASLATISEQTAVGLPFGRGPSLAKQTPSQDETRAIGHQPSIDQTKLRWALGQLTRGIAVLHAAGKIHRDIKPSNVLMDFGLVREILYQALTGQLPFDGSIAQILLGKQQRDAASPRTLCADIPEDLEALCIAMLSRAPEARPKGEEILQRLGLENATSSAALPVVSFSSPFVGREEPHQKTS